MALFHLNVKQIKRSQGQSAIASAAYRAGEKLSSEYYGEIADYTHKGGVICSEILLPDHVPREYADRETLWNAVEKVERGKNAQLAYCFDVALQNEFSMDENIALARQFLLEQFVSRGMIVDFAVHFPDKEDGGISNPHFHVMCPIRPICRLAQWDGWGIFFVDDGFSGTNYDRPGFQSMLEHVESGKVGIILYKDLSRLGRNSALTGLYTNFTFPQNGVRFIAINDDFDSADPNSVNNDFAGIKNWFNEFYARDTSRKIRAVNKAKGERGIPLTTNVPYGSVKDPENPKHWIIDPEAVKVVKHIFELCMEGRGPSQIANQLKADKVLTPTAYHKSHGRNPTDAVPENPCGWNSSTVVHLLERREYTGCTVNSKTYTNSIWDKKKRHNSDEAKAIFYDTHEAIVSEDVFEKVQQIREQRHRKTKNGRTSICSPA